MNNDIYLKQVEELINGESNMITNMANLSAFINQILPHINWVGFYIFDDKELVLGPFQGKVACTRIPLQKGVCGTAAYLRQTLIVDDVHQFQGHIACDQDSCSEIVIPIIKNHKLIGVLDIDSPDYHRFTKDDQKLLESIIQLFIQSI